MTICTLLGPATPALPTSQRSRHITALAPWTADSHGCQWTLILTTALLQQPLRFELAWNHPCGKCVAPGVQQYVAAWGAVIPIHATSCLFCNPRKFGKGLPSGGQMSSSGHPANQAIPDALQTGGHALHHSPSHGAQDHQLGAGRKECCLVSY